MKRLLLLFTAVLLLGSVSRAEEVLDSVSINFRQSKSQLEMGLSGNQESLDRIVRTIGERKRDSLYRLSRVLVVGGASPEGGLEYNRGLSQRRANSLFDYLSRYADLPDSVMEFRFLGRDWRGLARLVEQDAAVPFREETVVLIEAIAADAEMEKPMFTDPVGKLKRFKHGEPYRYMYRKLFPDLRASKMYLTYEYEEPLPPVYIEPDPEPAPEPVAEVADTVAVEVCKPFYMAIKSNMLYDALLVPNIGVEFYLGKNISIAANWMYAWWKCDHKHNYWRTYGGDIEARWWFGSKAHAKPLTGHHLGLYGQMLTYDFELGGRGYLGPKWSYGGGVSYGYSLPVARRINIDFTLGIGYLGGKYKEYVPVGSHYVWQATKQRHWFGPTKAEVTFVWLIGCDNKNNL